MTRPPLRTRRSEEFARLVDGGVDGRVDGGSAERFAPLVRTVALLREAPAPVPRPEFVSDLRTRLMAAADEALAPGSEPTDVPARQRRWERRIGAAAAAALLVGSTGGIAYAAEGSLPGSPLYPVKRGLEHVQVAMNTSQEAKGKELLDQASTRLHEVDSLMAEGPKSHTRLIRSTLADFRTSASHGSDLLFATYQGQDDDQDIAAVREFTTTHVDTLESLARRSPASVAGAFDSAGATLSDIDQQALVLCQTCSDRPPITLPSRLLDLSSARSLVSLVVQPLTRLAQSLPSTAKSRAEAAAAEKAAAHLGDAATNPPAGADAPASTSSPPPSPSPNLDLDHPVTTLVSTLTGVLPPLREVHTDGVTGSLDHVIEEVTDGLGSLTRGLLGDPDQHDATTGQGGD